MTARFGAWRRMHDASGCVKGVFDPLADGVVLAAGAVQVDLIKNDAVEDDRLPAIGHARFVCARLSGVSTTDPSAGVSVLDFGGGDVSVPVCFGDPVLVEDWGVSQG